MSRLVPAPLLQLYMQDLGLESKYKTLLLSASGRVLISICTVTRLKVSLRRFCVCNWLLPETSQQTALGLNHLWCTWFSLAVSLWITSFNS